MKELPETTTEKKSLKKRSIIIIILLIIIGLIVALQFTPKKQFTRCIENENYSQAVLLYNNFLFGSKNEQVATDTLNKCISDTVKSWENQDINFDEVIYILEYFQNIKNEEVSSLSKEKTQYITIENDGDYYLKEAEKYFTNNALASAIESLQKINITYSAYEESRNLYTDCKTALLSYTDTLQTIEEYEECIAVFERCIAVTNDADLISKRDILEQDLQIQKEINAIIEKAATLYDSGSYKESFEILATGITNYEKNTLLTSFLDDLHTLYVIEVTSAVYDACEAEDYKLALSLVDAAIAEYDCSEFQDLKISVREQKNILYKLKNDTIEKLTNLTAGWNIKDVTTSVAESDAVIYIVDSAEKMVLGDFSDKEMTILALSGNIACAIFNADLPMDIRDLVYDLSHMEGVDYVAIHLATDVVALLPVIGVVKCVKYIDDAAGIIKASDLVRKSDTVSDATKTKETVSDAVDSISNTIKLNTKNSDLINKKHPVTKVPFKEKTITYSDGTTLTGVYPVFKSFFDLKIEPKYFKSDREKHKELMVKALQQEIAKNPILKIKFKKSELEQIAKGEIPSSYTVHHSEEEGLLQLVDSVKHAKPHHTGGYKIWGKDSEWVNVGGE